MLSLSRKRKLQIPLYTLIGLCVFASVQAIWWVSFQVREGQQYLELNLKLLEERVRLAEQEFSTLDSLSQVDRVAFEHRYDGLTLAISDRFPSGYAPVISPERQHSIWKESRRRVRMFALEGMVFILVLGLGVWFQARAYQRQLHASEQQSNFVSAVTHELKSPLTSIRLFGELAGRDGLPAAKRAEISKQILSNADRLKDLVDQILQARKLEEEHLKIQLRPVKLEHWLASWAERSEPVARAHGFEWELTLNHSSRVVLADPVALSSALDNLLSNAMKYSPGKGRIRVQLDFPSHFAELSLSDEGVGFDEVEGRQLFERFYRAGNEMTRRTRGTGLGLFIVRELMAQMHGKALAESDGPGRGARFSLLLPSRPEEGAA